ncbi:tRNA pseudouridine synthase D [Nautilia profundicola AmH]|uniref:tRNA pseudouridine synthase D n=1 Tax=Nautilia profundicola (strain ATCC BAA-1463 / DSM 18972 / AmH) TaxID=598659 RepID=B9LA56_NAUPA|nr:tRNA pseudouridine(13) synthase TruD [Nautilia profundicola]ACM92695.1 tRNA pseudouridine synthase D [Nautilia profundicola AmH]
MIYSHAPINFVFNKNSENFFVEEIPLYSFDHTGEWLMLKVRKKDMTTSDVVNMFSKLGIQKRDIGYAGLKDKDGLTVQWMSVPRKFRDRINKFEHSKVRIVEQDLHRNKLKIGHLKGNRFFVRLKKVLPVDAKKIERVLIDIKKFGIPNFFGYQRFGKFGDNFEQAKEFIFGDKHIKDKRLQKLLISAYQSKLFNDWLMERIKLSNIFDMKDDELKFLGYEKELIKFVKKQKHPFKLLPGDVMCHYPFGKNFYLENLEDTERFYKKDIVPTGLLPGKKAIRAKDFARTIEEKYDDLIPANGDRRSAWIFPEITEKKYIKEKAWYEFSFILPKGSYATVLIEILQNGITDNLITYKGDK